MPRTYTSVRLHSVLLRLYLSSASLLCIEVKAFHGWTMGRAACRSLAVLAPLKMVGNGHLHPSQSGAMQGCAGMGTPMFKGSFVFGWIKSSTIEVPSKLLLPEDKSLCLLGVFSECLSVGHLLITFLSSFRVAGARRSDFMSADLELL